RSIQLNKQQDRELSHTFKTTADKRLRDRCQAVRLAAQGQTQAQVAQALCVSERSVRRWLRSYRQKGTQGLVINWAHGQPALIPESVAPLIQQWVVQGPVACGRLRANWTYAELAAHLKEKLGISVCRRAMCNFCHKHGIRPYRPTYRFLRGNPQQQQAARE